MMVVVVVAVAVVVEAALGGSLISPQEGSVGQMEGGREGAMVVLVVVALAGLMLPPLR